MAGACILLYRFLTCYQGIPLPNQMAGSQLTIREIKTENPMHLRPETDLCANMGDTAANEFR